MHIVRILAIYKEKGCNHKDYKLVFICGIDDQHKIIDGDWMGYEESNSIYHPFIFKANKSPELFYGGDERYSEPTNLPNGLIEVGRLFTVFNQIKEVKKWEATYEIISCHSYMS